MNVQNILSNRTLRVVPRTSASFASGLQLYSTRVDKGYSMTDCIYDEHFEQEGFRVLFRET
jgi:hypothetical protein